MLNSCRLCALLSAVLLLCISCLKEAPQSDLLAPTEVPQDIRAFFEYQEGKAPLISAHRGGPYPGFPENCLATFDHTLNGSWGLIECDVVRTKDGQLLLMHDETLDRTTTGNGKVVDRTWAMIQGLKLKDNDGKVTDYKVPTLEEALHWAKGKAILTLDIKRSVDFEDVIDMVREQEAEQSVVMITYTLGAAKKIHRLAPELMISTTIRNQSELDRLQDSRIPLDQVIAFVGVAEPDPGLYMSLHRLGISCILGTLGNLDRRAKARGDHIYGEFVSRGADILATDRPMEVADVFASLLQE